MQINASISKRVTATFSVVVTAPPGGATTETLILKAVLTLASVEVSLTMSCCDLVRLRVDAQLVTAAALLIVRVPLPPPVLTH